MLKSIFAITFLGLCFQSSNILQAEFVLFHTPKTWHEAQSICRDNCFDLATINDMEEMAKVLEAVKDQYDSAVWIGLWRGNTFKWHWSLADKEFYKEGERNYFIWSFLNDNFNCGSYKYGTLRVNSCGNSIYFICFDETQQGKDQYILITQSKAWIDARDYCRTHYTDLTSLRNDTEYQVVQEVASGFEVWVGLFRDPWEWSDQSDSSFRYWKANKPVWTESYSCGALVKLESGRWDELACEDTYPFLCHCRIKLRIINMRMSSQDSFSELEKSLVQENMLEQMKQQLRNKNVSANIQLQWRKQDDGRVFISEP